MLSGHHERANSVGRPKQIATHVTHFMPQTSIKDTQRKELMTTIIAKSQNVSMFLFHTHFCFAI